MIAKILLLAFTATAVYWLLTKYLSLQRNIAKAKRSGLPYIVSPVISSTIFWAVLNPLFIPIIRLFPESWTEPWFELLIPERAYRTHWKGFEKMGQAFLVVSPGKVYMTSGNAEVLHQFTSRKEDFPKRLEIYFTLRKYGENIFTTDGAEWRLHRRSVSSMFNEKNTALVFGETIEQAQHLLRLWIEPGARSSKTLRDVQESVSRLTLHIITWVGFGTKMLWPGQEPPEQTDGSTTKYASSTAEAGHKLSFADMIASLMEHLMLIIGVPEGILKLINSETTRQALTAHEEFLKYADEMVEEKIQALQSGRPKKPGMDILGGLVQSSQLAKSASPKAKNLASLTREEIISNAWTMLVAGHETTGDVLHFTMVLLAVTPSSQRRLQKELDEILRDAPEDPAEWVYEKMVGPLQASMVGACLNETMRLMSPLAEVPKIVSPGRDQPITMDGKTYILPESTVLAVGITGVHKNPRYWPTKPSKITNEPTDIEDYVPERWFETNSSTKTQSSKPEEVEDHEDEELGGFQGSDTSAQLYRPPRGAFLPFSDGQRACLGRRIATVEMLAAMAVIFRDHSVELALDDAGPESMRKGDGPGGLPVVSDEEVAGMSREEKRAAYARAQEYSWKTMGLATALLTTKLNGDLYVPMRVVKRGEERFVNWLE